MAANRYDAIIIGGGHNGLVCGSYLAKAGLKVLVLERRHVFGGAAVTEEFAPGFRASIFSYVMSILHPRIIADLELRRFGLEVLPANDLFCPLWNDDQLDLLRRRRRRPRRTSPASRRRTPRPIPPSTPICRNRSRSCARCCSRRRSTRPAADWAHLKETARLAWEYRKIGTQFYRIVDLLTQSADDYLSQWFESDVVKAVFAYYASIGTFAGPKTPGSAYVLLHHLMGEHEGAGGWGFIKGGMGTITQAIAQSGARFGLEVRTDSPIAKVLVSEGRATGVVTEAGEEYLAPLVISNLERQDADDAAGRRRPSCPRTICATCAASAPSRPRSRSTSPATARRNTRRSTPARLGFDYPTYVHIAPDIEYLERAYDDAKYGSWSKRPFVTPVVPTIRDDTLAPPGKHVVNLFGGHAPYELKGAVWDEAERDRSWSTPCWTRSRPSPPAGAATSSTCRCCSPPTSSGSSACRRATSSTASWRPTRCSSPARPPTTPTTAPRSAASMSAAARCTRAAA